MQLLKTIGSTYESQNEKTVINNLRGLSNRIKQANQAFAHKAPLKANTELWIKEKGVNLLDLQQQIITVQEQQKKLALLESIEEKRELKDNPLEPSLKDLSFDDFTFQCEENIAYRAILLSLNPPQAKNRVNPLKQIIKDNYKKVSRVQESPSHSNNFTDIDTQSLEETV